LSALLACIGTCFFLARIGANRAPAALGAYAFSGFFAGHSLQLPVFQAAACFPWLLLSFRGACDSFVFTRRSAVWPAA
jgi:hypothetical protein